MTHTVEWMDALYLLGNRALAYLLTYLLTYTVALCPLSDNISETVKDRARVIINGHGLYKVVHGLSIAAKIYDLE